MNRNSAWMRHVGIGCSPSKWDPQTPENRPSLWPLGQGDCPKGKRASVWLAALLPATHHRAPRAGAQKKSLHPAGRFAQDSREDVTRTSINQGDGDALLQIIGIDMNQGSYTGDLETGRSRNCSHWRVLVMGSRAI